MTQLRLPLREQAGIEASAASQDRQESGWLSDASDMLRWFCRTTAGAFTVEDFRDWAEKSAGLSEPANGSAYGKVLQMASRSKLIIADGFCQATNPVKHHRPLRVWRAA